MNAFGIRFRDECEKDGKGNFRECFKETLITKYPIFYRKCIFSFTNFVGLTFASNNILL